MRILQLSTYGAEGGATRAALRLHQGLRELGHDSCMLVRHGESAENGIQEVLLENAGRWGERARRVRRHGVTRNRTDVSNTYFSLPAPAWEMHRHPAVLSSEVLNLHWVADFLSPASVAALTTVGRPVVWTLHDQRAFTGGCHFSAGCRQYETDCGSCPQLDRFSKRLARAVLADARAVLPDGAITLVTPSRWLADCARRSVLFRNTRVEVIPYGLDTQVFAPQDRAESRRAYGIPDSAVVLLFGADHLEDKRKGFQSLAAGLRVAMENERLRPMIQAGEVVLAIFGDRDAEPPPLAWPVRRLGRIRSDAALARLYSAVDAVLLLSLEDNLPNVMLEGMSCGTPLLAHAIGGIPDVMVDGVNGLLVPPNDPVSLVAALERLILDASLRRRLAARCREEMAGRFALKVQAGRYADLYAELVADQQSRPASSAGEGAQISRVGEWGPEFNAVAQEILRDYRWSRWRRLFGIKPAPAS